MEVEEGWSQKREGTGLWSLSADGGGGWGGGWGGDYESVVEKRKSG